MSASETARPGQTSLRRGGAILDRDGTIIEDLGYVGAAERVVLLDGAAEAIAALNAAGVPVAVATNQAGVARGLYGIADVRAVHAHLDALLAAHGAHVDAWLFCPYHPDGVVEEYARWSSDRKPAPGMALAAAHRLSLDLTRSWVVGDSDCDVDLAHAVGAQGIRIGPLRGDGSTLEVPDLATAVTHILSAPAGPLFGAAPAFPQVPYESPYLFAEHYAGELGHALHTVDVAAFDRASKVLADAYDRDAAVFVCGNGGSASIANHLQCDHVKGVRVGTDLRTRVTSLSANVEILSAIANDIGYDAVFEYQLESMARPGDVLVAVSSSGRSANIVRALRWAEAHGLQTIAMTGFGGGEARNIAGVCLHVDARNYGIVEDAHQACMHLLAQYARQSRMAPDAVATTVF